LSHKQTTLDEFKLKKCRYCGRVFESERSLHIHVSRRHADEVKVFPGEGVEVRSQGRFAEIRVRVRKTLLMDLIRASRESNTSIEELIIGGLSDVAAFGRPREPSYLY